MSLFNNWLAMAFAAPLLWALVNLIDAYFAKEAYRDEFDAAIVSNLFHLLPWFFIPFIGFSFPGIKIALLAMSGGMLYSFSYFFYFRSLFRTGDTTLIQSIWNLSAVLTPLLAFIFISEKLGSVQYLGIAVVFLGAMILSFERTSKSNLIKILPDMLFAAFLFSVGTIIEERVYVQVGFRDGFLLFALGSFLVGLLFLFARSAQGKTSHLLKTGSSFGGGFLAVEVLALMGAVFYQRALSVTPAVSLVAVIEIFMPAFILIESVIIFFALKFVFGQAEKMQTIHDEQIVGWKVKSIAIIVMAVGVYVINR